MGVPNFFSWLVRRYPLVLYDFDEPHHHSTDFLFLDMNQIIYKCATNPTILFKDQVNVREFEEIWANILTYLNIIIDTVAPQQMVFMAFDGVAPRAKMNQQRQRRFMSAKHNQEVESRLNSLGFEERNETFKNNQISAGTLFMEELNTQVKFFIKRKFYEDPKWQHLQVVYSGSDIAGEGEHKIMEFIRNMKQSPNFNPDWTYTLYGCDADLIMLGLTTRLKYFTLLREKMPAFQKKKISVAATRCEEPIEFQVINLGMVRDYMDLEYGVLVMKVGYDINRVIDDFIMVCSFVGNDFLPRVFCFDIKQGTLELLLLLFKQQLKECDQYLMEGGKINWTELLRFTKRLDTFEKEAQKERGKEILKQIPTQSIKIQELLKKELNMINELQESYQKQEISAVRQKFYHGKCGLNLETDLEVIKSMAQSYLKGMQFVMDYYYNGLPSWEWYYDYYYAPLCFDLYLYLQEQKELKDVCSVKSEPFPCYKQLLCILSPSNANLLPQAYRHLFLDPQSPLRSPFDYYPSEFEIDPFGAIWEHQFIAKIPFLDRSILQKAFLSVDQSTLSEFDQNRLKAGMTLCFTYDQTHVNMDVKSTLPNSLEDFSVPLKEISFDFQDIQQCIAITLNFKIKNYDMLRVPRIQMQTLKIQNSYLKDIRKRETISKKLIIYPTIQRIDEQLIKSIEQDQDVWLYCGYPQQELCQGVAVITPDHFSLKPSVHYEDIYDYFNVPLDETEQEFYEILRSYLYNSLDALGIEFNIGPIVVVKKYKSVLRKSNGTLHLDRGTFGVYPSEWVSTQCLWDCMAKKHAALVKPKGFHEEFRMNEKVVVFCPSNIPDYNLQKFNGSVGQVKHLLPSLGKLVINQTKLRQHPVVPKNDGQFSLFYKIQYVAYKLKCSVSALIVILGDLIVLLNTKELIDGVDIGLNVVKINEFKLVPELARISEADPEAQGYDKYQYFYKHLELSHECVRLLCGYQNQFPQIFEYLSSLSEKKLKRMNYLNIGDLFKDQDTNRLYQVYIWILKQKSTKFLLSKASSTVLQSSEIKNLINHSQSGKETIDLLIDPGLVMKEQPLLYIPPYYTQHPPNHTLKSRVLNLNSTSSRFPQFGATGTVVGLIDQGDIYVEVLWDQPQIGLTDLGGKCPQMRGSIVNFDYIFNLTLNWSDYLCSRKNIVEGWDHRTKLFYSSFTNQSIGEDKKHDEILKMIQKIKNPFDELKSDKEQIVEV